MTRLTLLPGIIPARAGSTQGGDRSSGQSGDHPRSRGEHAAGMVLAPHGYGSSPLARGARGHGRRHHLVPGIIPARAGSTPRRPTAAARPPDHPRSRGEHSAPPAPSMTRLGSSPLARGARRGPSGAQGLDGIIPARAGSTMTLQRRPKWPRDHPRSRGEHRCSSLLMPFYVGSSPLARGAHLVTSNYSSGPLLSDAVERLPPPTPLRRSAPSATCPPCANS